MRYGAQFLFEDVSATFISGRRYAITGPKSTLLVMSGHEGVRCRIVLTTAVLSLVLNVALIPTWGITGAAVATALSWVVQNVLETIAVYLILGIRLAGPVLIALFLTGTTMGVLSRTMPQLNILTVGFAVRLMIGLAVAGLSIIACEGFFVDAVWDGVTLVREAFGLDPGSVHLVS